MITEPLRVTFRVTDVLDKYEVAYCLVGSLATSALGIPRATIDADLIADLTQETLDDVVTAFAESGFYVSKHAAEEALARRGMFNLIDLATAFKVDVYLLGNRPFDREEFRRRIWRRLSPQSDRQMALATPEDLVLSKLEWFELGNRISERQWRDMLGVLRVQEQLDWEYLRKWARELDLLELLERARQESAL